MSPEHATLLCGLMGGAVLGGGAVWLAMINVQEIYRGKGFEFKSGPDEDTGESDRVAGRR